MKKTYYVNLPHNNMRIDRWVRNNVGNIPQGLIEKNLRKGKIKLNKKKILNYTLKGSIWFFIIKGTISTAIILLGIFYLTN